MTGSGSRVTVGGEALSSRSIILTLLLVLALGFLWRYGLEPEKAPAKPTPATVTR